MTKTKTKPTEPTLAELDPVANAILELFNAQETVRCTRQICESSDAAESDLVALDAAMDARGAAVARVAAVESDHWAPAI